MSQHFNPLHFSFASLKRDWQSGELRLLCFALIIAVASITSVGFFTDRIQRVMQHQAGELLGADLVLDSRTYFSAEFLQSLESLALQQVRLVSFRSVVSTDQQMQLAEVKAVESGYPLRGQLRIAEQLFAPAETTDAIPASGEVWVESRLLQLLKVTVGEEIQLGNSSLRITKILAYEPDRGGDLFNIAPRVLMNWQDVAASGLILPGSRVKYRLLLAGSRDSLDSFRESHADNLPTGISMLDVREARPELRTALKRAEQFLGLAGLVSVLLAGVAIASCARRFSQRHFDSSALMRCLGASRAQVNSIYLLELLSAGLIASLLGCALGYLLHLVLAELMSGIVQGELPPPAFRPVLTGIATGLISLLGFALPPLLQLQNVPPARVLRRDLLPASTSGLLIYLCALAGLALITLMHTGFLPLTQYMLASTLATILILALITSLLLQLVQSIRSSTSLGWRYGLANLVRNRRNTVVQTVALGIGLTVILILAIVRGDLLASWQDRLPADAPNNFLINIQPAEVAAMRNFFNSNGVSAPVFYPMIRGRLLAINDHSVQAEDYQDPRAQRLATREFNLSWATNLQSDNKIVAGHWWTPQQHDAPMLSVEEGIANTLGIELGDSLTYQIADQQVTARVSSLRSVEWDSFNANFFVVAPPRFLESYPATWITSFHLAAKDKTILNRLVREFPSITVLDIEAIMSQIRSIMERVTLAVEYVFLFTLLAGFTVMLAALQSTHDQRIHEAAILRLLGANNRRVLIGLLTEFTAMGLIAGCVAATAASLIGWGLSVQVLNLPYTLNPLIWISGILGGSLSVLLIGLMATRQVLTQTPLSTLRKI